MDTKRKTNAQTAHSIELRAKTAKEWGKKLNGANLFQVRSIDVDKIAAIKSGIASMPGKSNVDKLLLLLDTYNKSADNQK
mgnify:CR=1 FL=1